MHETVECIEKNGRIGVGNVCRGINKCRSLASLLTLAHCVPHIPVAKSTHVHERNGSASSNTQYRCLREILLEVLAQRYKGLIGVSKAVKKNKEIGVNISRHICE